MGRGDVIGVFGWSCWSSWVRSRTGEKVGLGDLFVDSNGEGTALLLPFAAVRTA